MSHASSTLNSTTRFRLILFGTFHLETEQSSPTPEIRSEHSRRLLAALSLHAPYNIARAHLAGILYPTLPEERARRALNQALWQIRKSLGRDTIESSYTHIRLGASIWTDVAQFREWAQSDHPEDWRSAIHLYQGDFWPGGYDDWVLVAREQLREQYLALLERLSQHYESHYQYEEALHYMRIIAQAEPFREHIHYRIMQLCLALDRPSDAIRQYEQIARLLKKEWNVEPTTKLQTLRSIAEERLVHASPSDDTLTTLLSGRRQLPLIGRHIERAQILELIEAAYRGQGSFVFIEAEAGLGKSRLMQEIEDSARWRGIAVGLAHSTPHSTPYTPLREAISSLFTPVLIAFLRETLSEHTRTIAAHLWPELGRPAETIRTDDIPHAIVELIHTLAQHLPLVLILEDMHTADTTVFNVLSLLAQEIKTIRCVIILTYRPLDMQINKPLTSSLVKLNHTAPVHHITLTPLNETEKRMFLGAILQVPPQTPIISQIAPHLNGNPLHIIEAIRYLHRHNMLQQTPEKTWQFYSPPTNLHLHFSPLITDHLQHLPAPHRRVLEMLAVFGERIPSQTLVTLIPDTSIAIIHDLIKHGFLTVENETFTFSHALIQESIYQHLSPETRRTWHRRIARHLREQPSPQWGQIAHHLELAGLMEEAQQAYIQATRQALSIHAYEQAQRYCQSGLALDTTNEARTNMLWFLRAQAEKGLGHLDQARSTLAYTICKARQYGNLLLLASALYEAGQVAWYLGKIHQAVRFYKRALQYWHYVEEESRIVETQIALAEALKHLGCLAEAQNHLDEAIQHLEMSLSKEHPSASAAYSRALAYKGSILFTQGDLTAARTAFQHALEMAKATNDLRMQGFTLNALARIAIHERQHNKAQRSFEQALHIAHTLKTPYNKVVTMSNLAVVLSNAGLFEKSLRMARHATRIAKQLGLKRMQASLALTVAWNYTMLGHFHQANKELINAKTLIEETSLAEKYIFWLICRSVWYREQGDLEQSIVYAQEALAHEENLGFFAQRVLLRYEFGTTLLLAHRYEEATDILLAGSTWASSPIEHAFLKIATAVAQTNLGQPLPKHWPTLLNNIQRIDQDEYLPRTWYFVWLANQASGLEKNNDALYRAYSTLQTQALELFQYQHTFLNKVFSHRLITQAWLASSPRPIERLRVFLPRRDGTGDTMVTLTIDAGEEDALIEAQQGYVALRQYRIQRLLREAEAQNAHLSQRMLADILHVSLATIRRDLRSLRTQSK